MPPPDESARLNLQLYQLRREPLLEAHTWFLPELNPESSSESAARASGGHNVFFRMVRA